MATTLGQAVNRAHRTIGEPDITAFDANVLLQNVLIDDANETIVKIMERTRYRWGLHRDYITTTAKSNSGAVTLTNGSTTLTSVAAVDGAVAADNFGNVSAGMFFRRTSDLDSYRILSVDTGNTPDILVLEDAYIGSTSATGVAYNIFQDTYAISISNLDEIQMARYGSAQTGNDKIKITDVQSIMEKCGGDLHRNVSGKPMYMAQVNPDSSDVPQWLMWPFPDSQFLIEVWYSAKFTTATSFSTNLFGGDAPEVFSNTVIDHMRATAFYQDEDFQNGDRWMQAYQLGMDACVARDSRTYMDDQQMSVKTYDRGLRRFRRGVSQIAFDRE